MYLRVKKFKPVLLSVLHYNTAVLDLYILIQERWLGFSKHMLTLSVSVWMLLEAPEYLKKKKKKAKINDANQLELLISSGPSMEQLFRLNLEFWVLVFMEGGKDEYIEKKSLEQGWELTKTTINHIWLMPWAGIEPWLLCRWEAKCSHYCDSPFSNPKRNNIWYRKKKEDH